MCRIAQAMQANYRQSMFVTYFQNIQIDVLC